MTVAYVQDGAGQKSNTAITLGSAPTNGNLLIAVVLDAGGISLNTGSFWTQFGSTYISGSSYGGILYHYVGPGESATLTAAQSSTGNQSSVHVWEVSGAGGSITSAIDFVQWDGYSTSATSGSSTSHNTGVNNELVLVEVNELVFSYSGSYPTIDVAWTPDTYLQSYFNQIRGGHKSVASAGTAVTGSFTFGGGGTSAPLSAVVAVKDGSGASTIVKRSTSTGPNSYSTSTTTSLPSGTTTGDFTILCVVQNSSSGVISPPSGWTAIINVPGFMICYRMWQSGDPTSVTTTSTAGAWFGSVMATYEGVDASTPIDVANFCTGSVYKAPNCNPQYQGGMSILSYAQPGTSGGAGAPTAPSGYTQETYVGYGPNIGLWDKSISGAPATGNQIVSWSQNPCPAIQVVLKASGASAASPRAAPQTTFAGFDGTTTQIFGGGPTISYDLTKYNVQDGDLVIFGFFTGLTITTLATFSVLQASGGNGAVYYRTWHSGDATSLTWTFNTGGWVGWTLLILRNAEAAGGHGINPVIDTSDLASASSATVVASGLVPANTDEMLLCIFGSSTNSSTTWTTPPSGLTADFNDTAGPVIWIGDTYPAANPSGSQTMVASTSRTLLAIPILISPSTIGGGGPTWDHNPVMVNSN
jgi:hypothetical protein